MLTQIFEPGIALALSQAAVVIILALAVALLARWQTIYVGQETAIALLRGLIQIVAVGSILGLLLQGPIWTSGLVLLFMMLGAAAIAARRAKGIPHIFWVSFYGIAAGAGTMIALMTLVGVIEASITSLIPVGSMVIANAMNANALALERFRADVTNNSGYIEAGLALGAAPNTVVQPYVQAAVSASLIPRLDSLRSLGIVWIPGLMAGMVLSGTDPIYAAIYQFVVIAMIYASSGLTTVTSTLLVRRHAFSAAEQLILRSETVQ